MKESPPASEGIHSSVECRVAIQPEFPGHIWNTAVGSSVRAKIVKISGGNLDVWQPMLAVSFSSVFHKNSSKTSIFKAQLKYGNPNRANSVLFVYSLLFVNVLA